MLVSIIVPVYNVEKYLDRCVNCLINQTHKDVEILLIDDGSPDNCPAMCDAYAQKDNRIKVFHKNNGGLSSARNMGLDNCTGDFLTFIDSDDYLDTDWIEKCHNLAVKENLDVVLTQELNVFPNRIEPQKLNLNDYKDTETIVNNIIWDKIPNYASRFFRASLWEDIRFPLNTNWEDFATMPEVFAKVKAAKFLAGTHSYYECNNCSSISNSINSKNKYGMCLGWRKRKTIAETNHDEKLLKRALYRSLRTAVTSLGLNTQDHKLLPEQVESLTNYIKQEYNRPNLPNIGLKYKLLIWSLFHCPNLLSLYGYSMYFLQKLKKSI